MKKNFTLLFILLTISFGCRKDYSKEIDDLRNSINNQAEIITNIQKGLYITNVNDSSDGLVINFSNGQSYQIKDSVTPIVQIGANGNWSINGADTGVAAKAIDGKDGNTPTVSIGPNSDWIINGKDTGIKAKGADGQNGQDGKSAPTIQSIYYGDTGITFNFSDGSSIQGKVLNKPIIGAWGDSLTAGDGGNGTTYPSVLQSLLGDSFQVINFGIGGESSLTIGARQGGIPMYLANDVTLPADNTPVVIGSSENSGIKSTWDNNNIIMPYLKSTSISVNDCIIGGVNVILNFNGSAYTLQRIVSSNSSTKLLAGSVIYTAAMRYYRNNKANVFFVGQNGGFTDNDDLIKQIKALINFNGSPNCLVVGLTSKTAALSKPMEDQMRKEFGARFVNLREYLSTTGLSDAGITPTANDINTMASGSVPPSLLTDNVHFNKTGYQLIGKYIYNQFKYLGVF